MRIRELARDRVTWIFVAIVLAMFYRPLTTETFYFRDLYRLSIPKRVFFADSIRAGELPLWDPLMHGGQPFLASPSNFFFHPSNLLYLVLPPISAFNLILVLHVLFCVLAACWAARTAGLGRIAAFVCGAAFGFSGYALSAANHTLMLLALPWIPMATGLAHRALRDRRSLVPAAMAATMPLFCGAAELTAMLFVTLIAWIACIRVEPGRPRRVLAASLIVAGALGLSLLQTLPATSVIAQSSRSEKRSYEAFTNWSVHPKRLPELVIPRFLGDLDSLREADYWGRRLETGGYPYVLSLYLGLPLILLACAGALARGDESQVPRRAMALLALAGILFSLGQYLPMLRPVYERMPLIGTFRYPVKAQLLSLFPLAILAACGVESLATSARLRRALSLTAMAFALVLAATATGLAFSETLGAELAAWFSFTPLAPRHRLLLAISMLQAVLAAGAFAFAVRRETGRLVAAIVALDLVLAGLRVNDFAPRSLFEEPATVNAVRNLAGQDRFHSAARPLVVRAPRNDMMWLARWQLETLEGYTAAWWGIRTVYHSDYDGLAPQRMARLGGLIEGLPWPGRKRLLDRAAVRAFLTADDVQLPGVRRVGALGKPGLVLYANAALPRQRFVSVVQYAASERDSLLKVLRSNDRSTVTIERSRPQGGHCGDAAVNVVSRSNHAALYDVDAPCAGVVVFSEPWYEGWRVTVDGRREPLLRADHAFSAVAVGPGRHRIERTYVPPLLLAGFAGSLATLVLLVIADRRFVRPG